MSSVLLLGVGPLPIDQTARLHAPGIRTWHLAQLLAEHKHRVIVVVIKFGDFQGNDEAKAAGYFEEMSDRLSICTLKYHPEHVPQALATLHRGNKFDCVLSTTDIMNGTVAEAPVPLPMWFDYLGDPFTEKQIQTAAYGNDSALWDQWPLLLKALLRGDRFSAASTPQKNALIGQLGFSGRLNQFTAGEELVHVLPNCSTIMTQKKALSPVMLKGRFIPAEAFMVLWAGGYNSWCDPDTLFRGLEIAMRRDKDICFVSAGGEIRGHDNVTFERFRSLVEASDLTSRFYFAGWVDNNEIPSYYMQADAAINVDAFCYEAEIGTRTRIIDWIQYETPVITTSLCEPAKILAEKGLIHAFSVGNPESLAAAILDVRANPESAKELAKVAREFFVAEFDGEKVFAPLLRWVEDPAFAPDRRLFAGVSPSITENMAVNCNMARLHGEWIATHRSAATRKSSGSLLKRAFAKLRRKR
jgi:glycosyltransferase involved in cell wall biosynthesis